MAGCNRMAGLSDGFQVRVSISTIEINTQTRLHTPFSCAYTLSARKTPMQRINADMLMLNAMDPWKGSSFDVRAFVCLKHISLWWISEMCCDFYYRRLLWHICLSQLVLWCAYRQENSARHRSCRTTDKCAQNNNKLFWNFETFVANSRKNNLAWGNYKYNTNALLSNHYSLYTI